MPCHRGILVFSHILEAINRGVHVENKILIPFVSFRVETNRYFVSFSVSLPNSVSVEKRKIYVVDV
jgi:hypothetical protein